MGKYISEMIAGLDGKRLVDAQAEGNRDTAKFYDELELRNRGKSEPKRTAEIPALLESNAKAAAVVFEMVDQLERRLEDSVMMSGPEAAPSSLKNTATSPIGSAIETSTFQFHAIGSRLRTILERLAV